MSRPGRARFLLLATIAISLHSFSGLQAGPVNNKQSPSHRRSHAPAFSLTGIYGGNVRLSTYRGKVVVIDFWATWCKACETEIPRFIGLEKKYRLEGFQILGISMDDDAETVREFYKRFGIDYPVAMADEKIGELYGGVVGLPTTFLIGRDGLIYDRVSGEIIDFLHFTQEIKTLLRVDSKPAQDYKKLSISTTQ
jgi:cytochrome c biogenesis protein CcmG, thiol:disulfide interchange protein DsbE